jgi:hypothetical protein
MERKVYSRPPALSPSLLSPLANQLREEVFFAGVRSSRVEGGPLEADLRRNVEGFYTRRCGSVDTGLPKSHGVREVNGFNAFEVMEKKISLPKSSFESVTELSVAHGLGS